MYGVVCRQNIDSSNAEGDGEDEEAFEKRLAALKSKRGTPSRSSSGSGSGSGDEALTPYQQLKQNQAEEKDRKKVGARGTARGACTSGHGCRK